MTEFISTRPISEGWSGDEKYCAQRADGSLCLLRISPAVKHDARLREFEYMRRVDALGVPMCHPIEAGECERGVYVVHSWIDGENAESILPTLPRLDQYRLGLDAGRALRLIHSVPAPPTVEPWGERFARKLDRKLTAYASCPVRFEGDEAMIAYIGAARSLIDGRPQSFQHGDFHVGNMMLDREGRLVIIDFDRSDFGDPWEEFNRIVWSADRSPAFASGIVEGYFVGEPPELFWRLMALYICGNSLSSVPWALPFGDGQVGVMLRQMAQVLGWYDGLRRVVPSWYVPGGVK